MKSLIVLLFALTLGVFAEVLIWGIDSPIVVAGVILPLAGMVSFCADRSKHRRRPIVQSFQTSVVASVAASLFGMWACSHGFDHYDSIVYAVGGSMIAVLVGLDAVADVLFEVIERRLRK